MTLIMCPLKIELKFLKEAFLDLKYEIVTKASHNIIKDTPFTIALGGHGKVNFALSTFEMIKTLKPDLVICAGAAGGLKGVKVFEVLAATKTIEHDYKQGFGDDSTLPSFEGDAESLLKLKHLKNAPIASGDEDIVTKERAHEIQTLTGAKAVAWEGAGGAKACVKTNTPFLELRFISDLCNEDTGQDFRANLPKGMHLIAQELLKL